MTGSLDTQVGGTHYADLKYQPIFVCEGAGAVGGFSIGNMFKYLCRYPHKGEYSEDLQKAKHYAQIYQEVGAVRANYADNNAYAPLATRVNEFCSANEVSPQQRSLLTEAVLALVTQDFSYLILAIDTLLAKVPDRQVDLHIEELPPALSQLIEVLPASSVIGIYQDPTYPHPFIVVSSAAYVTDDMIQEYGLFVQHSTKDFSLKVSIK